LTDRQDDTTPPSGYDVPEGAPPPTEQDRVPTPWELQQQGGQETVESQGPAVTQENPASGDGDEHDSSREAWQAAEDRRAGELSGEAAPPNETAEGDEEYQWHTTRTGRSETAESDAVEFIDVVKAFGRNTVLNGLNLGIPEGQISMILGPSGTGKSVCIKHMVGLLYPDQGDVLVHGESVPNMRDDDLFEMRKKFGVLFQDGALFGSMNLWDNVAFPLRQHTDKGEEEISEIVGRRLREVGLAGAGDKMPNELSGGMRKRAGFARALVLDPQIVLFDEPDSGLDPVRTALLCELIKEIHEENGGAYVVITHDIMSARRVAEYIAILWKGRIVESGPASELFNSDNQFVRQFLSGEARGPLGME
jgi:phospholipid/cholesterol/gamma-HCH transport system ATP-binding protein